MITGTRADFGTGDTLIACAIIDNCGMLLICDDPTGAVGERINKQHEISVSDARITLAFSNKESITALRKALDMIEENM